MVLLLGSAPDYSPLAVLPVGAGGTVFYFIPMPEIRHRVSKSLPTITVWANIIAENLRFPSGIKADKIITLNIFYVRAPIFIMVDIAVYAGNNFSITR